MADEEKNLETEADEISEEVIETKEDVVDESAAADDVQAEEAEKPVKVKNKKKKWIIIGVVAAVVIAAGVGFWVWHEQPSFCGAICHTPMDSYYENYANAPEGETLMITAHAAAGDTCLECHVPTISQQISEGIHWISGNYEFNAATDRLALRDNIATAEFCLSEDCHNMTVDELEKATESLKWNPHDTSMHGDAYLADCSNCHRMHSVSVMVCAQCHGEAKANMPEGWAASEKDATAIMEAAAAAK